jgi:hypothetical protein
MDAAIFAAADAYHGESVNFPSEATPSIPEALAQVSRVRIKSPLHSLKY